MKKKILCIILLGAFLFTGCQSETDNLSTVASDETTDIYVVPLDKAIKIAELNRYLPSTSKEAQTRSAPLIAAEKRIKESKSVKTTSENADFYIITYEDGGFVIIAGDKRALPVLAHSDLNSFPLDESEYPIGLKLWMEDTSNEIDAIRKENKNSSALISAMWDEVSGEFSQLRSLPPTDPECQYAGQPIAGSQTITHNPLTQTVWRQGVGYNDALDNMNCASYSNGRPSLGCVTVAVGQLMRYYQKPASFSWSNMSYTQGTTTTQNFLKLLGEYLDADYSCSGTGVLISNVVSALKNQFGYSYASYSNINYNTVFSEITSGHPVILTADDANSTRSHAWICDGVIAYYFNECNVSLQVELVLNYYNFHMVWGWDSYYNGWYSSNVSDSWAAATFSFQSNRKMLTVRQ
jgi:hypothetical protein